MLQHSFIARRKHEYAARSSRAHTCETAYKRVAHIRIRNIIKKKETRTPREPGHTRGDRRFQITFIYSTAGQPYGICERDGKVMRVHAGLRGETQAIHAVHEARADLVAVAETAQRDGLAYAGHARHAEHCVRVFVKLLQNSGVQLRMGCGCVDGGWVDAGVEERCEGRVVCVGDGGGVRGSGEIVRGKLVRALHGRVRARGDAVFNQLHKAIDKTIVRFSTRFNTLARRQTLHGVAISALFHILTCIPRDADIDGDELRGDAAASDARVLARVERFEMDERMRCGGGGGEQEDGDGGCVEREVDLGAVGCVVAEICVDAVRGEAGDDLRGERGFGGGVRDEYCCLGVHGCGGRVGRKVGGTGGVDRSGVDYVGCRNIRV